MELEIPDGTRPKVSSPGYFRTSVITEAHAPPIFMRTLKRRGLRTREMGKHGKVTPAVNRRRRTSHSGRVCPRVLLETPPFAIVTPSRKSS